MNKWKNTLRITKNNNITIIIYVNIQCWRDNHHCHVGLTVVLSYIIIKGYKHLRIHMYMGICGCYIHIHRKAHAFFTFHLRKRQQQSKCTFVNFF